MGTAPPKDQGIIRGLELSAPPPDLQGKRGARDWVQSHMTDYSINHVLHDETSVKTPKQWDSESVQVDEPTHQGAGSVARPGRDGISMPLPWYPALCIWLFLNCILYNKLVIVSEEPPWVLWVVLGRELLNLRRGLAGSREFVAKADRSVGTLESDTCNWHLEWELSLGPGINIRP